MTKFRSFLFEDRSRSTVISSDEFKKIMGDYSVALKNYLHDIRIYRGNENAKGKILLTKPSEFDRVSANTFNFITLLVDNMPEWNKYPKRSKSIICSSSSSNAEAYGSEYIVLPKNGSSIGVCPDSDWWFSFGDITINSVNNLIAIMIKMVSKKVTARIDDHSSNIKDYDELMKLIKEFDSDPKYDEQMHDQNMSGVYQKIKGSFNTFEEAIKNYMNPNNYKFKLIDVKDYKIKRGSKELWTDGDSVLINETTLVGILEKEGMLK